MKRIEYPRDPVWTRSVAGTKPGPWQHEPSKIQWQDEVTGLPCLIVRNSLGALCGYVGVSSGHPVYLKHYDDDALDVDVHGGLSFSARCSTGSDAHSICHVVEPGEPDDVWWLGFDCAHVGDLVPGSGFYREIDPDDEYRDIAYVTEECRKLAEQLKAMT